MILPSDQSQRDAFIQEIVTNFSVIAPAGVGKTTAIVSRILQIVEQAQTIQDLRCLVVVTYTNKAAREMQQRVRKEMIRRNIDPLRKTHFNKAFFGTIHSFCFSLLKQEGHWLGLPGNLEVATNTDILWDRFCHERLSQDTTFGNHPVFRYVRVMDILKLARDIRYLSSEVTLTSTPPTICLEEILQYVPDKKSAQTILATQVLVEEWLKNESAKKSFNPLPPECLSKAKAFVAVWQQAWRPLKEWISQWTSHFAIQVAQSFATYRQECGQLTYDDQIRLTAELLRQPDAREHIRSKKLNIILDEAQDTDAEQFSILLDLACETPSTDFWNLQCHTNLRPGAFCMVGDPQQSIYGDRADLEFYQQIRQWLLTHGGEEIRFDVTFRCAEHIIDFVNGIGASMLDGQGKQCDYVKLETRPEAHIGQVIRWTTEWSKEIKEQSTLRKMYYEARQVARWIHGAGLEGLQAQQWSEVVLLCPRKKWLLPFAEALEKYGIQTQIQSHREVLGDSPAYAWLTALATVMANPQNGFEIVGVLREIFGISDADMAEWSKGDGSRFQIEQSHEENHPITKQLQLLHLLKEKALAQPLYSAIQTLVNETYLLERLQALPDLKHRNHSKELQALLANAALAEQKGLSLHTWAEQLQMQWNQPQAETEPLKNCLQLMTCQKAKGLEWDAVIVPFLSRPLGKNQFSYPIIIKQKYNQLPVMALDGESSVDSKESLEKRKSEEVQRLFYVTLTRARNTLVLIDDAELFGSTEKGLGQKLYQASGFKNLPDQQQIEPNFSLKKIEESVEITPYSPLIESDWNLARKDAQHFIYRVLPHNLAENLERDEEVPSAQAGAGIDYGLWWHQMCESMPWKNGPDGWQQHMNLWTSSSVHFERAQREVELFLKSDLLKMLEKKSAHFHAEMLILHYLNSKECIEGVIDLAVFFPHERKWIVIDWKTNAITFNEIDALKKTYQPQLFAYQRAIEEISQLPCESWIYATALGVLIK